MVLTVLIPHHHREEKPIRFFHLPQEMHGIFYKGHNNKMSIKLHTCQWIYMIHTSLHFFCSPQTSIGLLLVSLHRRWHTFPLYIFSYSLTKKKDILKSYLSILVHTKKWDHLPFKISTDDCKLIYAIHLAFSDMQLQFCTF